MDELKTYWMLISVHLASPEAVEVEGETSVDVIANYLLTLGVSAPTLDDARQLAQQAIVDGSISWPESEIQEIEFMTLNRNVQRLSVNHKIRGIWYRSGRGLISEDPN